MDWNVVISHLIEAVVVLLAGVIGVGVKVLLRWMSQQNNTIVHTIGELAYKEVEANITSASGAEKMNLAIEAFKQRLGNYPALKNIDDQKIVDAIQKAWEQNEGQYKGYQEVPSAEQAHDPYPLDQGEK